MKNERVSQSIWDNPGPDEGWAWMIVLGLFITGYTAFGLLSCMGVIYPLFMNTMQLSPEEASWPFYISFLTSTLTGIVVPLLSRFYSIRQILFVSKMILIFGTVICYSLPKSLLILMIFFGIPIGILIGSYTQSVILILGPYFQNLKARAQALSLTGASLATITFALLTRYISEIFDYRATILLIGAAVAQGLPSTLLLRSRNEQSFLKRYFPTCSVVEIIKESRNEETNDSDRKRKDTVAYLTRAIESRERARENNHHQDNDNEPTVVGEKTSKIVHVFRDLVYFLRIRETYFVVIPDAIMMLATFKTFLLAVDHGYRSGIAKEIITIHFISFGTFGLLSRIAVAAFADSKYVNQYHIIKASVAIKIISCLIFTFKTTTVTFLLNSVFVPISVTGYSCLRLTYFTKLFEVKDMAMILALSSTLFSIGGIMSPTLIGISMTVTGDFRVVWASMAVFLFLGLLLMILEPFVIRKNAGH